MAKRKIEICRKFYCFYSIFWLLLLKFLKVKKQPFKVPPQQQKLPETGYVCTDWSNIEKVIVVSLG